VVLFSIIVQGLTMEPVLRKLVRDDVAETSGKPDH